MPKSYGRQFEREINKSLEEEKKEKKLVHSKNELLGGRFHFKKDLLPDFFVYVYTGDFWLLECKSCQRKTAFPFINIKKHQTRDLNMVRKWPRGYGVFLINFRSPRKIKTKKDKWNETFIVPVKVYKRYKKKTGRSSMRRDWIRENCEELPRKKFVFRNTKGKMSSFWGYDMSFLYRGKNVKKNKAPD